MHATTGENFSIVYSGDPAIGEDADYLAYSENLDESRLNLTGEPVRYVCRPSSRRERDWIMGERAVSENPSVLPYACLSVCLVEVIGADGKPILSRDDLERKRRLTGGVRTLPNELWDNEVAFPGMAVVEVGNIAFGKLFRF